MLTRHEIAIPQVVNLANLWAFERSWSEAQKRRANHQRFLDNLNTITDRYSQAFPELLDAIKELKLEIRLLVKGTPVTEPMQQGDDYAGTQQLSDAQFELLTKAYKKAAMIAHPDKGGDPADWEAIARAYKAKNLGELIQLYIWLVNRNNLFWKSSDEGLMWAATEMGRPEAQAVLIRATPQFRVVQAHVQGRPEAAQAHMEMHLRNEIYRLTSELNFLCGGLHEDETKSETPVQGQIDGQAGSESFGEGKEGTEPVGEGTPG